MFPTSKCLTPFSFWTSVLKFSNLCKIQFQTRPIKTQWSQLSWLKPSHAESKFAIGNRGKIILALIFRGVNTSQPVTVWLVSRDQLFSSFLMRRCLRKGTTWLGRSVTRGRKDCWGGNRVERREVSGIQGGTKDEDKRETAGTKMFT